MDYASELAALDIDSEWGRQPKRAALSLPEEPHPASLPSVPASSLVASSLVASAHSAPSAPSVPPSDLGAAHNAPQLIVLVIVVILVLVLVAVVFYYFQYTPWEETEPTAEEQERNLKLRSEVSGTVLPYKHSRTTWYAVQKSGTGPLTVAHLHALTGILRRLVLDAATVAAEGQEQEEVGEEKQGNRDNSKKDQKATQQKDQNDKNSKEEKEEELAEEKKERLSPPYPPEIYTLQLLGLADQMGLNRGRNSHKLQGAVQTYLQWYKAGFWPSVSLPATIQDGTPEHRRWLERVAQTPAVVAFLTLVCMNPLTQERSRLSSRILIHSTKADLDNKSLVLQFSLLKDEHEGEANHLMWDRMPCEPHNFDPHQAGASTLFNVTHIDCYVYEQDSASLLPLCSRGH